MRFSFKLLASLGFLAIPLSCIKEYTPVGQELLLDQTLTTLTEAFPIETYQEGLAKVQTNSLPLIQLGTIEHPVFGRTQASLSSQLTLQSANPTFGEYTQSQEEEENPSSINIIPENEKVTSVYLELPFFTNQNDRDGDGVIDALDADPEDPTSNSDSDELTDIVETQAGLNPLSADSDGDGILDHNDEDNEGYDNENTVYEVDSLYGNPKASFDLKVYELTYFLNALDPAKNFTANKVYYSDEDYFSKGFYSSELTDERITLNLEELRFNYEEDDPETAEVDETTQVETRLSPRLRVPLNTQFFQERLLDLEGSEILKSNGAFQRAMKGIIIQTANFSEDLYMLLNTQGAAVKIGYEYDKYNTNGTEEDINDDVIEKVKKEFILSLSSVRVNTLLASTQNSFVEQQIEKSDNGNPTDKLYLQSGRYHGKIKLFPDQSESESAILTNLKTKNWLINQARLVFYLDPEYANVTPNLLAPRLYLYEYENGAPLLDYTADNSVTTTGGNTNKTVFGGFLEYDDSNRPYRYTFDITKHISNLIRNESSNFDLGLVVQANIEDIALIEAVKSHGAEALIKYPRAAAQNNLGSVLIGSSTAENNLLKAQLEITYSSF